MIHEVDASLRTLIQRDAANGDVEVDFDAPTRDWAAKRTSPTIDVYLYDIREDLNRRQSEPLPLFNDDGVVIGKQRPPRHYRLSYLVTAWTQRPEDEHRLLSAVLHAFLPHDSLPQEVLNGALAQAKANVYATIGRPPPEERSIGDIWSAMGGELKPSLDLVVTAPFVVAEDRPVGPPVADDGRRFTLESIKR